MPTKERNILEMAFVAKVLCVGLTFVGLFHSPMIKAMSVDGTQYPPGGNLGTPLKTPQPEKKFDRNDKVSSFDVVRLVLGTNERTGEPRYDGGQIIHRIFNRAASRLNADVYDYCKSTIDSRGLVTGNITILDKEGKPMSKEEVLSLRDNAKALLNVGSVVGEVNSTEDMTGYKWEYARRRAAEDAAILANQLSAYRREWMNVRDDESQMVRSFDMDRDLIPSFVAQQNAKGTLTLWRMEPCDLLVGPKCSTAAEIDTLHLDWGMVEHSFVDRDELFSRMVKDPIASEERRNMWSRVRKTAPRYRIEGDINEGVRREREQNGSRGMQRRTSSQRTIDTSKLDELLKGRIEFLESLLKSGKRATNWQLSKDNSRAQEILSELKKIDERIRALNVPDDEKKKIAEDLAEKVKKTDKQLSQLMKKAIEQDLVPGLSQLPSNGMKETVSRSSGDDIVCICDNPNPFAVKVSSGIPASVSCENCGRLIGIEVNGRISSSNPAAKDKTARAVSFDEANAIKQRFQGRK